MGRTDDGTQRQSPVLPGASRQVNLTPMVFFSSFFLFFVAHDGRRHCAIVVP